MEDKDVCWCSECQNRDEPCQFDCDNDNLCVGCADAKAYQEEVRYEYEYR